MHIDEIHISLNNLSNTSKGAPVVQYEIYYGTLNSRS
jgi:hypothetical protein